MRNIKKLFLLTFMFLVLFSYEVLADTGTGSENFQIILNVSELGSMLPGDSSERTILLKNNTGKNLKYSIESITFDGSIELSEYFKVSIYDQEKVLFAGMVNELSEYFKNDGVERYVCTQDQSDKELSLKFDFLIEAPSSVSGKRITINISMIAMSVNEYAKSESTIPDEVTTKSDESGDGVTVSADEPAKSESTIPDEVTTKSDESGDGVTVSADEPAKSESSIPEEVTTKSDESGSGGNVSADEPAKSESSIPEEVTTKSDESGDGGTVSTDEPAKSESSIPEEVTTKSDESGDGGTVSADEPARSESNKYDGTKFHTITGETVLYDTNGEKISNIDDISLDKTGTVYGGRPYTVSGNSNNTLNKSSTGNKSGTVSKSRFSDNSKGFGSRVIANGVVWINDFISKFIDYMSPIDAENQYDDNHSFLSGNVNDEYGTVQTIENQSYSPKYKRHRHSNITTKSVNTKDSTTGGMNTKEGITRSLNTKDRATEGINTKGGDLEDASIKVLTSEGAYTKSRNIKDVNGADVESDNEKGDRLRDDKSGLIDKKNSLDNLGFWRLNIGIKDVTKSPVKVTMAAGGDNVVEKPIAIYVGASRSEKIFWFIVSICFWVTFLILMIIVIFYIFKITKISEQKDTKSKLKYST